MNRLLEKHRQTLVLFLSVLILAGSGVSLGFGIAEFSKQSPLLKTSGFVSGSENELINRLADEPITGPININTASASELEALPEIGPALASRIVDYRQQNGSFKTAAEIQNVSGIGPKTYEMIKDQITVK
jgi:competence protein ComEA